MSQSYSLYCDATRQSCCVGQSSLSHPGGMRVYSAPENVKELVAFLEATRGHPVVLLEDEHCGFARWEYEQTNEPDPDSEPCPHCGAHEDPGQSEPVNFGQAPDFGKVPD